MKKRYLAITMGILMTAASVFAGCGNTSAETAAASSSVQADAAAASASAAVSEDAAETAAEDAESLSGQTIYGEVTAVGEGTLTIATGTIDAETGDFTADGNEAQIAFGEDTAVSVEMAGGQGGSGGEMPEGGAPDMTSDENTEEEGTDAESGSTAQSAPDMQGGPGRTEEGGGQPPELPEGESFDGEAPEMPEGGQGGPGGQMGGGQPPEKPEGGAPGGTQSESAESSSSEDGTTDMQGGPGEQAEMTAADISEGALIAVTLDESGAASSIVIYMTGGMEGGQGGGMGAPGGQSSGDITYTGVQEISSDTSLEGETIASEGTDEEAVLVTGGAEAVLKNMTISRDSEDSTGGDNSSFYGVGAAVLTTDGTTYLSGSTITTDASGGAGVFSYGDGVTYVSDTVIETAQDTSGGIHAAGGGTLYAWDVTATTEGGSAAAIRSDRGGGTMVVDGGTYTSKGTGSPAIYSTADITVNDAVLVSENSEAICIEGLNSLRLYDCDLTGNMPDNSQNDCTWNVILYQSMSGDSEVGNSTFQMCGGTLTAGNGGMFYTTNTESTFILEGVDITYAQENDFFLKCTGNANERGWGSTGSNGADCSFTAIDQVMEGDVIWDSISSLDFYMTGSSTLTGAVIDDESNAGEGGEGYCSLYIESGAAWIVTGDSALTNLYSEGSITDADGNAVSIVGTDGTVYVEGTSQYTVTVESYADSADTSGASEVSAWEDYAVEKPEKLG